MKLGIELFRYVMCGVTGRGKGLPDAVLNEVQPKVYRNKAFTFTAKKDLCT